MSAPDAAARLLVVVAVFAWGCAASRPPAASDRAVEDFDPQSLAEDLLLIQPLFPPPDLPADGAAADSAGTAAAVYRVQIMALTNEAVARAQAVELERALGVPVSVGSERGYFLVRAGRCATAAEAEALRQRVVALNRGYTDAYVVPRVRRAAAAVGSDSGSAGEPGPTPSLVPVFGWRVLIDQFRTQEEADKVRQDARERLGRADVDLSFQPPWYRVEVGYCRTEAEAQTLVEDLQACGYRNALKVRAQVLVPQDSR